MVTGDAETTAEAIARQVCACLCLLGAEGGEGGWGGALVQQPL